MEQKNGKIVKALCKLKAVKDEIDKIKDILESVKTKLELIIVKFDAVENLKPETEFLKPKTELMNKKQKCMIETLPERIEFKLNHLKFYIDFTLTTQENDTSVNIKGCMIYGVNRSTCFTKCILTHKTDDKGTSVTCKHCERISRCDKLEDKPLIQFFIDRHGMIQSAGEFEDSWWIEKKDDLPELHFRAMELIWPKALAWTNENLLA